MLTHKCEAQGGFFHNPARYLLSVVASRCSAQVALPSPTNGRRLLYAYGCGSCHAIPGVGEADGTSGPPLSRVGSRFYIAGVLQNTTENMVHWSAQPQEVQPGNAMPDLGVTQGQARDIAAYLYTLR